MNQPTLTSAQENMFNFKWLPWPTPKIEKKDADYIQRVCGVDDKDAVPEVFSKIVKTLKRLRGEEV